VNNGGYAVLSFAGGASQVVDECRDEHLAGILADTTRQAL
jgi:hypothetical protein